MLIQDVQRTEDLSVLRPAMNEVVAPDMIAMLRSETDTRSVIQPEPPLLRLFLGNLQPLTPLQPFHPLVVHLPARFSQQGRDATVAVAAVLAHKTGPSSHR